MPDIHRNVFGYYKGTAQSDQDREQQQEDNTTKALINTLDYSAPGIATEFLQWLGIKKPGKAAFVLQKSTIGSEIIRRKPQRLLVAIVGTENEVNQTVCDQLPGIPNGESRPDAWVYGDDYVVLIESKIDEATLNSNQMGCHLVKLQPTFNKTKLITWAQVHKFFVALMHKLEDGKNKWLVEQLTHYLEWTGMTEFVGFREEMFEFFVQSEKDPDTKKLVRRTVAALAEKVLEGDQGLKRFNGFYEGKHVGNLEKESDQNGTV